MHARLTDARRRALAKLRVYLDPPVVAIALLGFCAGIPLALSGATLSVAMADRGVDLSTIGLLSLAGLPYSLKFLWAPAIDTVPVPILSRLIGHRRSWLVLCNLAVFAAIVFLGTRDPLAHPYEVGLGAVVVAAASATMDIVIDALRIDRLTPQQQAPGIASYVMLYRIGLLASGAGTIALAALFEAGGADKSQTWAMAYAAAGALVPIGLLGLYWLAEPPAAESGAAIPSLLPSLKGILVEFLRVEALAALAFIALFKLCDAIMGVMIGPFVLSVGYDKLTYAAIVKGVGFIASILGGIIGAYMFNAMTLRNALWLALALQAASNLAFALLVVLPVDPLFLAGAIIVENLTGGFGTIVFVAYLSALCAGKDSTATRYALLAAISSVGRTTIAASGGYLAQSLGWLLFFLATIAAALPAAALLLWLGRLRHFERLPASTSKATGRDD